MSGKFTVQLGRIAFLILAIGFFGTMTNKVYISPIPTAFALLLLPLLLFKGKIHVLVLSAIPYFLITILGTLWYHPESLVDFYFYRYDGNFFISFLPILIFPLFAFNFDLTKFIRWFLISVLGVYSILYFSGQFTIGNNFHGLFKAHNAAGGFFSFLSIIATMIFFSRKTIFHGLLILLSLFFLFETGSRGSLLGYIVGMTCLALYKWKGRGFIFFVFVSMALLVSAILFNTYKTYKEYKFSSQQEVIEFIREKEGPVGSKRMNIYQRTYGFWPRCLYAFSEAPLFGIGVGGINDLPLKFENSWGGFFNLNKQPIKVYDDQHGHNSYLHIGAEQGLVGLLLFLFFWGQVYFYLINRDNDLITRDILLTSFFGLSVMAFTEHRITTPSNVLPFVLLLSLYLLKSNSRQQIE